MLKYVLPLLCLSFFSSALSAETREPGTHFFDQSLGDLKEELTLAKDENKKGVLLFFEMEECPFCARMKQSVFNQVRVQDAVKKDFLIFPIDIEGDTEVVDFQGNSMASKVFAQEKNRVRATPVMIFYDLEGNKLYRHTGPTRDADEFLWMAEYVAQGHYKTMKFSQFRRDKRGQ